MKFTVSKGFLNACEIIRKNYPGTLHVINYENGKPVSVSAYDMSGKKGKGLVHLKTVAC